MAIEKHLSVVLQGVEAIGQWREEHAGVPLELHGAGLRRAMLEHADLTGADLREADLERADLRWAELVEVDLSGAKLVRADLHKAEVCRASLRGADLTAANLEDANFEGADFTGAIFSRTRLLNTVLKGALGLDRVVHREASEINGETLRNSGRLPDEFLKGLGLYDPYQAVVLNVLVGSPGDLGEDRLVAQRAIYAWNNDQTRDRRMVLLPRLWETDAVPGTGSDPQLILNRQLVDQSQILIALFWTRLGTPTPRAASGTVEEIERFAESGRPVLVYFCNRPVAPERMDLEQMRRLQEFKTQIQSRALIWSYVTTVELATELQRHLARTVMGLLGRAG